MYITPINLHWVLIKPSWQENKAVQTAERSFELASKRYNIGVMQTIEWLTNQNNLTRARIDKMVAQYNYVFSMKVLEFYKGQGLRL